MHTSKSAAVSDGMPALSSFRCSFNLAVSVTFICISCLTKLGGEPGEKTYTFDRHVELLGNDGLQAACKIGHDGGSFFFEKECEDWQCNIALKELCCDL
jgi:hypothetical protein